MLDKLFRDLSTDSDPDWLFIDGSIVKAHQDSSGAASDDEQAIGKSRGGNSTKIHLAVDSGGLPVHFEISGGQVNDIVHAENLGGALANMESGRYFIGCFVQKGMELASCWGRFVAFRE